MGLCVALETEFDEQLELIGDDQNLLYKLIGYPDSTHFPMLASIDWYGDTTFNRMQIKRFLAEWETLFSKASTPEENSLLEEIKQLSLRSLEIVHLYVVFIGDQVQDLRRFGTLHLSRRWLLRLTLHPLHHGRALLSRDCARFRMRAGALRV